ncbi:MAG: hypothetical protein GC160_14440 [Acidobacteria bacterium]|nr:hypothetical protein [Acidobacteriota bacterium]
MQRFSRSSWGVLAVAALALAAVLSAATEGAVSGPVLGYLFDQQQLVLRPILGVPGASHIAEGLPLNVQLAMAEVAPGQQYALGVDTDGGLVWIDLRGETPQSRPVSVGVSTVSRVLISPTGQAAAVYDRRARQVQFLSGMLTQPTAGATVSLADLQGLLTALAVSDDARTLLAATATRDAGGSLYGVTASGEVRGLGSVGRALALAFLPAQDNALVADHDRSEVLRINGVSNGGGATVLASGRDGVQKPMAVFADVNQSKAVVALAESGRLAMIPLGGGAPQFLDCSCRPQELSALRGNSLLRLSSDPRRPIYVLEGAHLASDGASVDPRIVFVPANPGEEAAQSAAPPRPTVAR